MFIDEVAVIDEIQMIRDPSRGWAWTRALLGLYNILRNVIIIIIFFKPKLLYYSVHLCRSLCRGDPRVWGTCSHRLYQRADVHHWRGGGGETVMDATSERKEFG